MAAITEIVSKYGPDIEQSIKHCLAEAPPFLKGVISYHFGWVDQNFEPAQSSPGKMIRPTLCLLVFESLTGGYRPALPAAAAIEMIHNFTLIHDDIEDEDLERRGRPTAWAIWGKPLAINVGDFLYTLSFKSLYQLDSATFTPETIFTVQRRINACCLALTIGQDMDLRFEQNQSVSTEMYLDMIYNKTGALLEAAIVSGALLGTSDQVVVGHYQQFAQNIGIAFQVRDDILGIWGDTVQTGKSVDNDLRRKKKTLPVIYMMDQSAGQRRERLEALYASPDPLSEPEIEFVRDNLESTGAYQYAQQMATRYREQAFTALKKVERASQAHLELETLTRFLIDRSH